MTWWVSHFLESWKRQGLQYMDQMKGQDVVCLLTKQLWNTKMHIATQSLVTDVCLAREP